MKAYDIVAYTFNADIYCPDCIVGVFNGTSDGYTPEVNLTILATALGFQRDDELSFDSSEFPKVIFADQLEETDWCAECHEALV